MRKREKRVTKAGRARPLETSATRCPPSGIRWQAEFVPALSSLILPPNHPSEGGRRCRDHPQRARVEVNLLFNANTGEPAANVLMGRSGQILRLYANRAERRLDPGNERCAEGKRHRDHPGSGQLRRQRARLSLRARPDRDDRASRLSARRWSSTPPMVGDAALTPRSRA